MSDLYSFQGHWDSSNCKRMGQRTSVGWACPLVEAQSGERRGSCEQGVFSYHLAWLNMGKDRLPEILGSLGQWSRILGSEEPCV